MEINTSCLVPMESTHRQEHASEIGFQITGLVAEILAKIDFVVFSLTPPTIMTHFRLT